MTNREFIGRVSYFLDNMEYLIQNINNQCGVILEEEFLTDNLIDNFVNYINAIAQDSKEEWEKIKEEREKQ